MECFAETDEISNCKFLRTLEKKVSVLRIETRYVLRINYELEYKLEWFHQVSRSLSDKLSSLWYIAEVQYPNNEAKKFADQISASWALINKQIDEKYSKIRMASRAFPGIPLSVLLGKIKQEVTMIKVSLKVGEATYDQHYLAKGYSLITEIEEHLQRLEKCEAKLQQYLILTKITPCLLRLESMIDKYVNNVDLLPLKTMESDLNVFPIVSKLLTGELLDYIPVDPHYVLAENAPKKPVFIIKNMKRR